MKRYPEYKESGVEWIGRVPNHWQVLRNFAIFSDRSDRGHPHLPPFAVTQKDGVLPQEYSTGEIVRSSSRKESGKRICKGDLVYNKMRMWQGAVGVAPAEGIVSTAYVVCQPIRDLTPEFFEYLYRTPLYITQLSRFSYGGCKDQYCLYPKDFKNIYTVFPPKQEQTQIAAFLDHKTAQIFELIRGKERRIALLRAQRTALINQAVTKGLDPNVEMKPSGVEWIGEIPVYWNAVPMTKYLESTIDYRGRTPEKTESGRFLVTAKNIRDGNIDYQISQEFTSEYEYQRIMTRGMPQKGDVLFTTEAPLGEVANVDDVSIALAQRIIKFRPKSDSLNPYFLKYWILSYSFQSDLRGYATGSTAQGIKASKLCLLKLNLPPLEEQIKIVDYLDQKTQEINELISAEEQKIELLMEYRQSLISEAVTGKIDVRNEV